jgi:hypothetical protein
MPLLRFRRAASVLSPAQIAFGLRGHSFAEKKLQEIWETSVLRRCLNEAS